MIGDQQPPSLAAAIRSVRTDRLHHHPHEPARQLLVAAVADQPQAYSGVDVAADRLAVHQSQPPHRPEAFAGQPQPQQFSNLEHPNLPERHGRLPEPV